MNMNLSPSTSQFSALFAELGNVSGNYHLAVRQNGDVFLGYQLDAPSDAQAVLDDIDIDSSGEPDQLIIEDGEAVIVGMFEFNDEYTPAMVAAQTDDIAAMLEALTEFWNSQATPP